MSEVQQRAAGFGCRIGTVGPVVISVFEGKPELGLLDLMDQVQTETVAQHGRFTAVTVVAMTRLEPPSVEFRTRGALLAAKHQEVMVASATVILSKGVAAVIARAFLAAYSLISQQRRPQQSFRDIAPAIAWLQNVEGQLPEVKQMTELTAAVERFTFPK
jgi:hypothetical protein